MGNRDRQRREPKKPKQPKKPAPPPVRLTRSWAAPELAAEARSAIPRGSRAIRRASGRC